MKQPTFRDCYLYCKPMPSSHLTKKEKPSVWILVVKWEDVGMAESLGHIRMFAIDAQTLETVGFSARD